MARKLKTYQTSTGFFEHAIAVPSMKAALEAWVPIAIYPLRCREGELGSAVIAATATKTLALPLRGPLDRELFKSG